MNFSQPLPQTFDLGFPLEHPVFLRTRTGLQDLVTSNRIIQLMGHIVTLPDGRYWEPLFASQFIEPELADEPFMLWEPDPDSSVMPEATCGVAVHLVQLDSKIWKVAYRQFLGSEIPRACLNKMLTSMTDWVANTEILEPELGSDGEWVEIKGNRTLCLTFRSLRFALNSVRGR